MFLRFRAAGADLDNITSLEVQQYAQDRDLHDDHSAAGGYYSEECTRHVQGPSGDDRSQSTCG